MNDEIIKIECLEFHQPIGVFYVGKINIQDLLSISYADVRRIEREEKNDIETYFGIQRNLSNSRVKEIADYVRTLDATFPSSILIAISSNDIDNPVEDGFVEFDPLTKCLLIKKNENIAHIIDGQHRVFGFKKALENNDLFKDKINQFDLMVTIFIDMDPERQAIVFSTINKAHTKVNKSLVYDLFDLAKTQSPQRSSHNIVKLLNEKDNSPFKDKIKMLGLADDTSKETIAQATFVELILRYISNNPMIDRDTLKRGKKLDIVKDKEFEKYFFRNWFILGEEAKIAKILWNYFNAVRNKWPEAWEDNSKVLTKSTGLIAFMRLLKDFIANYGLDKVITEEEFKYYINNIDLKDKDFINSNYKSGGVGQSDLYKDLKLKSGLKN
jgi:DGQHR domain-containing protein